MINQATCTVCTILFITILCSRGRTAPVDNEGGSNRGNYSGRIPEGDLLSDREMEELSSTCSFGVAGGNSTVYGFTDFFNEGRPLPQGTYVVEYFDGCFKTGSEDGWTVSPPYWWIVLDDPPDRENPIVQLPSITGVYEDFEDCVDAHRAELQPVTFYLPEKHVVGVCLQDGAFAEGGSYANNTPGLDGRIPQWNITALTSCLDLE